MRSLTFLALGSMVFGIGCASRVELPTGTSTSSLVAAAISAATLGNDCGTSSSFAGDCAEAPSSSDAGTGARGGCGGGCQQSNVQLALTNSGKSKAAIAVVEIHLLDAATSERLDDVDAKNARVWTGSSYNTWDSSLAAGADAKVSYDMTQIDWTKIGGGNPWNTYSRRYKLEVVLRVDGADRTLVSGELSREPEVVTQSFARFVSAG
jgi:hypothetical protein